MDFLPNARFRAIRKRKRQTQNNIAEELSLNAGTISKIENFHCEAPDRVIEYVNKNMSILTTEELEAAAESAEGAGLRHSNIARSAADRGRTYEELKEQLSDAMVELMTAPGNEVDVFAIVDPAATGGKFFPRILAVEFSEDVLTHSQSGEFMSQRDARDTLKGPLRNHLLEKKPQETKLLEPAIEGQIWAIFPLSLEGKYAVFGSATAAGTEIFIRSSGAFFSKHADKLEAFIDPTKMSR